MLPRPLCKDHLVQAPGPGVTVVFLTCLVLAQWDGGYCCGPFAYAWGVFQSDFSHLPSAGVHKEG